MTNSRFIATSLKEVAALPGHLKTEVIVDWERLIHHTLRELENYAYENEQLENAVDEADGPDPL